MNPDLVRSSGNEFDFPKGLGGCAGQNAASATAGQSIGRGGVDASQARVWDAPDRLGNFYGIGQIGDGACQGAVEFEEFSVSSGGGIAELGAKMTARLLGACEQEKTGGATSEAVYGRR